MSRGRSVRGGGGCGGGGRRFFYNNFQPHECGGLLYASSDDKVNPVNFMWKWGEDDLPIENQSTYLGVEVSKACSWHTHIVKVMGKGEAPVGEMHAILADSHLDTRFINGVF